MIGEQHVAAGPGSFVFLPRNLRHSWRIHTEMARLLITFAPAGIEAFLKQIALPIEGDDRHTVPQTPPHMVKVFALAHQYGLTFRIPIE